MTAEIITALDQSINDAHARFLALGERNRDGLIAQINAAREVGTLLRSRKEQCRHGEFSALFKDEQAKRKSASVFDFSSRWARVLMKLSTDMPEEVKELATAWHCLTDCLRAVGALPASSRGEQSRDEYGPFAKAQKELMSFFAIIGKEGEKAPVEQWPLDQCENLAQELLPAVELHQRLKARILAA